MPRKDAVWAGLEPEICLPTRREVYLVGGVDDAIALRVMKALRTLDGPEEPVRLVISSDGGEDDAGWAIYDTLRSMKSPTVGEVAGRCLSIAVLVLQACSTRESSQRGRFLLHNGTTGFEGEHDRLVSTARELVRNTDRYHRAIAERSGQTVSKINRMCQRETWLGADEALRLGLLDKVRSDVLR